MNKRAYETIDELNRAILNNEEEIMKINKYIQIAKDNYDVESFVILKDIKQEYKALNRRLRQDKKVLMKIIKQYLQANYRVTNTFKDITLNTINDNLPVRLSDHALRKLVKEIFPEVQERKCTNDIKYNMEMIL